RSRASSAPASFAERPPPAAGFTMAINFSFTRIPSSESYLVSLGSVSSLKRLDCLITVEHSKALRQGHANDLERSGQRKVFVVDHDAANAFVMDEPVIAGGDLLAEILGECLPRFEVDHQDELLAQHGAARPNIVCGKNAEFLHGQPFKSLLDVFRVNVLSF